jgi:predicted O-methyltransferase YrrM
MVKKTGVIAAALKKNDESIKHEAAILEKLFNEYESDKCILHNYNYLYAALFKDIKDSASRVLEIGTYKGASLRSWKNYFTTAEIYGIDIDPDTVFVEPRINTMIADQNNMESLGNVNVTWRHKYDVIIDDGWHQPEASVFTMLAFVPQLREGGIYVLEDIDQRKYHMFYKNIMDIINESDEFYAEYIDFPSCVPPTGSGYNYGVLVVEKL